MTAIESAGRWGGADKFCLQVCDTLRKNRGRGEWKYQISLPHAPQRVVFGAGNIGIFPALVRNAVLSPAPDLWVLNLPVKILSDFSAYLMTGNHWSRASVAVQELWCSQSPPLLRADVPKQCNTRPGSLEVASGSLSA